MRKRTAAQKALPAPGTGGSRPWNSPSTSFIYVILIQTAETRHDSEGNNFQPVILNTLPKYQWRRKAKRRNLQISKTLGKKKKQTYLPCTLFTRRPLEGMFHQLSGGSHDGRRHRTPPNRDSGTRTLGDEGKDARMPAVRANRLMGRRLQMSETRQTACMLHRDSPREGFNNWCGAGVELSYKRC